MNCASRAPLDWVVRPVAVTSRLPPHILFKNGPPYAAEYFNSLYNKGGFDLLIETLYALLRTFGVQFYAIRA